MTDDEKSEIARLIRERNRIFAESLRQECPAESAVELYDAGVALMRWFADRYPPPVVLCDGVIYTRNHSDLIVIDAESVIDVTERKDGQP